MILYLQKNASGTFTISEKNNFKSELFPYDYYTLIDNISGDMTYKEIKKLVKEKFDCKKLVIDL